MGKFESYEEANTLSDDDITLYNKTEVTHKITFATLVELIRNKLATIGGVVTSITAGAGLAGGTITSNGTIKCNLKSETSSTIISEPISSIANRQYAVGLDKNGKLSVNVPWEDSIYNANNGVLINGNTIQANLKSSTYSTLVATAMGTSSNRQYAVGLDKDGYLSVNIPWVNYTANNGVKISGDVISAALKSNVKSTLTAASMGSTSSRQYAVGLDASGNLSVNIPWKSYSAGLGMTLSSTTFKTSLADETQSSLTALSRTQVENREYPVGIDANGNLSVNVPWESGSGGSGMATDGSNAATHVTFNSAFTVGSRLSSSSQIGTNSMVQGYNCQASANYSHAEGNKTNANGNCSHAEGIQTKASLDASHAEGNGTSVNAAAGHAEGTSTKVFGHSAHSEGFSTSTEGDSAHAEGYETFAQGNYSHAEGYNAKAYGEASHAEGNRNKARGYSSHAEGYYTETVADSTNITASHVEGYGNNSVATGLSTLPTGFNSNATYALSSNGMGSHVEGCALLDSSTNYTGIIQANNSGSHAEGYASAGASGGCIISSGLGSHAEGYATYSQNVLASGSGSHAEGSGTNASGEYSHAEGIYTQSDNIGTHSEGCGYSALNIGSNTISASLFDSSVNRTIYSGFQGAHAEGCTPYTPSNDTNLCGTIQSLAMGAHAEGYANSSDSSAGLIIAKGRGSHAEGFASSDDYVIAQNAGSHAEGCNTKATGRYGSHAEGYNTQATGETSHAEGYKTQATGENSHAEGDRSIASGASAHAEGYETFAQGNYSHAEGCLTKAQSDYSHAGGRNVTTIHQAQFAQGGWNIKFSTTNYPNGVFCVSPSAYNCASSEPIDATLGHSGTAQYSLVTSNPPFILNLKEMGIYSLYCVGYSNDNTYSSVDMIAASRLTTGTPVILNLGHTSTLPVTITASSNNQITLTYTNDVMYHLIRIL